MSRNSKLPNSDRYILAVTKTIKNKISMKDLFYLIYKREGTKNEVQSLTNRLNAKRSNPSLDLISQCIINIPSLQDLTLKEFFHIDT